MYAIVEIAGKQYKVAADSTIVADKIKGAVGDTVEFDNVLMFVNDGKVKVGSPTIKGAKVTASIEGETRGDTVIVFRKKRRKGFRVRNGHRQQYTKLKINEVTV